MDCVDCGATNLTGQKFCGECGSVLAAPAVEVRKTVSVVFCDLVGSTALGERVDAEVLRGVMGGFHAELRRVLEQHGGTVEKFVGDAVMAVFGVPQLHEDDALRAVRAAVLMREAAARLGLEVRIGVNTGEVVVGTGETLATGDAVNVAARLEQAAAAGQILLGDTTARLVSDEVELTTVEPFAAKGKRERLVAHELVRLAEPRPSSFTSPLIGRERDLALLEDAFRMARDKRVPQLATVVGAPGVGKSRLVAELLDRSSARVLVGHCLPYGDGITYWPVVEMLDTLGDPADHVDADDQQLVLARLAAAVGTPGSSASPEEIAWALRRLLEAISREGLVVAVFEDIHWAAPALLDLIEYVATFARDAPLVLLCTARPELLDDRPGWATPRANETTVQLEPLPPGQAAELASQLCDLPEGLLLRIVEASDGNPLFLEQLVAVHRESPAAELEVPPSLQALLSARIDRLEREERLVVERAAVEGRRFHRGAVAALLPPASRPDTGRHLVGLVRRDLVRPDQPSIQGEDGFRFGHILIRDAAYDAMSKRLRAELHEQYADWLGERLGEGAPQEILGFHLERAWLLRQDLGEDVAVLRDRAGAVLAAAGRAALERGDIGAAGALLERALRATPGPERRHVLLDQARVLFERGDGRERDVLAEVASLARIAGDERTLALAEVGLARHALDHGEDRAGPQAIATAEAILASVPEDAHEVRATALILMVDANFLLGAHDAVLEAYERGVVHARAGGHRELEIELATCLASVIVFGPMPVDEGRRRIGEILDHLGGEPRIHGLADHVIAHLAARVGQFDGAREALARWRDGMRDLGRRRAYATTALCVWDVALLSGDLEYGESALREGYAMLKEMGETAVLSTQAAMLGDAALRRGQVDEAERFARESRELGDPDDVDNETAWRCVLAKVLAARGEHGQAVKLAREAVEGVRGSGMLDTIGDTFVDLAQVLRSAGDEVGAREAAGEALERYRQKGSAIRVAEVERFLAV